ncbi:solute carrier family 15 member 1-like isoform X2 [Acanthaster planci]|uniref:Solute carrier family 15 member 1-like isoform X2 n=1 Tax=Acanthaster planci TaxID=133434 RepID=A0A8B8A084_ACAPL|nr:solute carrier family 15 member 1-like isoform X2 [Acanthaster planci]XP_022110751.1 solute carrier family 15 member 1-like isoform X2 [Acanthaster planci]XP_022110759.1 solute carrier family 15 member 1-like isoform X2 [Acanthaster planci]XP_022110767.1 solute carrier family 15 member 1-like isoform X2 [Acanthaster planci]XP_022110776.1 solute carrier family 15 member 1-like isoform X2 [Acanthaster planci]
MEEGEELARISSGTANKNHGATALLDEDQPKKLSGKAWGRMGKFLSGKGEYPKSIFFIIGTEFCERFSYYGMKAILVLYLTNILLLDDDLATALFHAFAMLCYFTPIFGAMIADSWLGKYRTILYVSQIYMVGNVIMCLTALPPQTTGSPELIGPLFGLFFIALGTGGIKPCVSAFGGDQFSADQEEHIAKFFSVFYFSINAGSVISTFLTPILRHDAQCFGNDCYALAFGVPALLMFVAVFIFFSGRYFYKVFPPSGNVVWEVVKATFYALKNRFQHRHSGLRKDHWMDWADDKYDSKLITDIKDLYHVLKMFLPLPIFWSLFDQQGSRWTLQAEHMDGTLGSIRIKPDQMQAFNPVLIIILIPVTEMLLYPLLRKLKIPFRPLQRMTVGMMLGGAAFVVAGFNQLRIDASEVALPGQSEGILKVINAIPCDISVQSEFFKGNIPFGMASKPVTFPKGDYEAMFSTNCPGISDSPPFTVTVRGEEGDDIIVFSQNGILSAIQAEAHLEKPRKGQALVSVGIFISPSELPDNTSVILKGDDNQYAFDSGLYNITDFKAIEPASYDVYIDGDINDPSTKPLKTVDIKTGAVYRMVLQPYNQTEGAIYVNLHIDVEPNSVSMFLQIPQYIIITIGEIFFSITGLEFSYSQAPASLKSCVQAAWLLTVAFGNLIVIIVAEVKFVESQAMEFFLFAGLMGVIVIIFAIMAYFYVYITPSGHDEDQREDMSGLVGKEDLGGYQAGDSGEPGK